MSIVTKIKHNPYFQTITIIAAAGIVVYSIYPFFIEEKKVKEVKIENVVPKNITEDTASNIDKTKPSLNPERRKEELKIEHELSSNVGNVFLKKQYDTNIKNDKINRTVNNRNIEVNLIENKNNIIPLEKNRVINNELKLPEPIKKEEIENKKEVILKRDNKLVINKDIKRIKQVNSKEKAKEIAFLTTFYNINNKVDIAETYYDNKISMDNNNISTEVNNGININSSKGRIKIIPGSSFNGELLVNQSNLFSKDVKAIVRLNDGPLKDYILIGDSKTMQDESGMIIHLNRLIDPIDGTEQEIDAIAINIKDLTPRFVDEIDRKLLPRVVIATLGSLMDYYIAKDSNIYQQPNSLLSQEMQKELNRYTPEIKVDKQLVAVIFY